ncbi:abc transporter permease [Lucifera butyrica]|uniref:Abc transporter permease n=1 Tax=Lucifera butyrica TaxID=1351585 RepID=A0A498R7X8_9FIRM|nr:ABC transporter permease [Lucifera butyrica]VBB07085.1 abc transporter permease [Lucifera butyrica]
MKLRFKLEVKKEAVVLLLAILLGLIAGAVFMALTGSSPITGYEFLFKGGLMNLERIGNTLATATPLIFTGLSVAFAFRTGLFNIGAAGQMLIGGFCATAVGLTLNLPKPMLLTLMVLAATVSGALWATLPGYFKARFNVHEVVSTIMFNWIAYWVVYYAVPAYFKGAFETESRYIPNDASLRVDWMAKLFDGSYINLGIFLALAAVILIAFILNKTTLGYELKAVGFNRFAAEYAGINANRGIVLSMMIAGALAGLGGMTLYCGYATSIQIGILPSQGIDGIAVALLGANSPWGVFAAALFFGTLYSGKGFMNAMTNIPPEIADTIIATIIYFAATSVLIEKFVDKMKRRLKGANSSCG